MTKEAASHLEKLVYEGGLVTFSFLKEPVNNLAEKFNQDKVLAKIKTGKQLAVYFRGSCIKKIQEEMQVEELKSMMKKPGSKQKTQYCLRRKL